MRISDWSSDVCSSDLPAKRASMAKQDPSESRAAAEQFRRNSHRDNAANPQFKAAQSHVLAAAIEAKTRFTQKEDRDRFIERAKETVAKRIEVGAPRSEEHTSELQSLMRISYAVFCVKKKNAGDKDNIVHIDDQYRRPHLRTTL